MPCTYTTRQVEKVTVIDASGWITIGESSEDLRKIIHGQVNAGRKLILLNFREVARVDSAGISGLMYGLSVVAKSGGALKLCGLRKWVKEIMIGQAKLDSLVPIFDQESTALASFGQASFAQVRLGGLTAELADI